MIEGKKIIAIIPARGGSKRLPRKNVIPLLGKPLLAWSIEAVKNSKYIDHYVVSSDDEEILNISESMQAPILRRPDLLATDTSGTIDVVLHALDKTEEDYDFIVVLQPTSPLRKTFHIDNAIELFIEKNATSVISVCETDHPVEWSNILPDNKCLSSFLKDEFKESRSQDFIKTYRLNGAIYIYDTKSLKKKNKIGFDEDSYAFLMDKKYSIDIDEEIDFEMAEFFLKKSLY